ncbi:carbohydrate ABC transporter permease [Mesoaciditoga lauensis]|uniref:carbohydrate ABC transporter permease n=1 Tax=Mesoaciditoga lauensis TaxID=1495039 RepID=UPI000567E9B8|nr:sugar ABC transporter permease [Mesoaciditoga lauensis]
MNARFKSRILPYLFLTPAVGLTIIFLMIPAAQSAYESFFITSPFGNRSIFVGLDNYISLLTSSDYIHSIWISIIFSVIVVSFDLVLGVIFAVLLNNKLKGITVYRTILILTYAISPVVAGTIWSLMFAPSTGPMTYLLKAFFHVNLNWMINPQVALIIVAISAGWKQLGYNIIFSLAGLQNVPGELLEAAEIDGASPLKKFFTITIPLISPTLFFLLIMDMFYSFFQVFGVIDVMTQGGPGYATDILVYQLYKDGFVNMQTGLASSESVLLFLIVLGLVMLQFRFTEKSVFYS